MAEHNKRKTCKHCGAPGMWLDDPERPTAKVWVDVPGFAIHKCLNKKVDPIKAAVMKKRPFKDYTRPVAVEVPPWEEQPIGEHYNAPVLLAPEKPENKNGESLVDVMDPVYAVITLLDKRIERLETILKSLGIVLNHWNENEKD